MNEAMRLLRISLILAVLFGHCHTLRADAPATQFFVIETAQLTKLAPTDQTLASLRTEQLSTASVASGWYAGGLSMVCELKGFRIEARFDGAAAPRSNGPPAISYHIDASTDRTSWNLVSVEGTVTKSGPQYVTRDWRKQQFTVILRLLDLKE
jgi:hypothetical protein